MRLSISFLTNIGRLRRRNEDSLLIGGRVVCGRSMDRPEALDVEAESLLVAVADGMGGLPCGDRASCEVLRFLSGREISSSKDVEVYLREAKTHLDGIVEEHPECLGMGTAVAGVFLREGRALIFNVGDCRVYRLRDRLERLTRDHTEAYELFERGYIDEEEIRHHPLRNILTSAVVGGYAESFDVFVREVEVENGDTYLLCSDGLWDELTMYQMEECLREGQGDAALCLFRRAYEGGKDNISFVILRVL